jgi:phosphatidylglycerol lysyltransferase
MQNPLRSNHPRATVTAIGLATLGSGILNIYSVIGPSLPGRMRLLKKVFPLEFMGLSRSLTLLIGFALVISSHNLFKRKRRALLSVLVLACASVMFHLAKGIDYEEATLSVLLVGALVATRRHFTVKSRMPAAMESGVRLSVAVLVAFAYGVAGFWLLDQRHFGINFHLGEAVRQTLLFLLLVGDPALVPHTRYARWFVDSLYLMTATAFAYSGFALFRPVVHRYTTRVRDRSAAREIASRYGLSALDYFKTWEDKSYFFSRSRRSFLAYRVASNFAVVLGDPLGPHDEVLEIIGEFARFCRDNDWGVAFYQALPDFRDRYRQAGFKTLKIGDDAVVDLEAFSLEGKTLKATRTAVRKLEKAGVAVRYVPAPVPKEMLDGVQQVSDDWLRIPGRRERTFTLGLFDRSYVRNTPLLVAVDSAECALAFANIVPSGRAGELTIDLMRRRANAPNGIMDFLLVHLFLHGKANGYTRVSLGMAPMAGFQEHEQASAEERAVHAFFQRLGFVFSFKGLRAYKAKFATSWEPRYVYYSNVFQLPRIAIALGRISTVKEQQDVANGPLPLDPGTELPGYAGSARPEHRLGARSRGGRLLDSRAVATAARPQSAVHSGGWRLARLRDLHGQYRRVVGL